MSKVSTKEIIMTELRKQNKHTYYADTTYSGFPRVIVFLVNNTPIRYSNVRHSNKLTYQISYFSKKSLDVETDPHLMDIIDILESKKLVTSNWRESAEVDEKANSSTYHYWLEVYG